MRSRAWLLAAACWPAFALAQVEPLAELRRMETALGATAFSGVVVFSREGQLDALRIRRSGEAGRMHEQIERLTGPSLPMQRDAEGVWFGNGPRIAAPGVDVPSLELPDRQIAYELRFVSEDRVAGRVVNVVDARARDALRFGHRYWIDRDTGVALRAAAYGADGILVEQWMFASFEIDGAPGAPEEASLPSPQDDRRIEYAATSAAAADRSTLQVLQLPSGFELVSAAVGANGEQLVYSDGLVKVSVFVEPIPAGAAVLSGLQRRGALSVFGRVFEGLQVVVVGEVPPATAERFAQGVARRNAG